MKILSLILGCLLIVYSAASILFDARFENDPSMERLFCRFLVCADNRVLQRAYRQLWEASAEEPLPGLQDFQEALIRNMAYPYRWCDLGEALFEAGQVEKARYCFRRASNLGSHVAPILLRVANFHFRIGETREALSSTSRLLKEISEYDPTIFSTYRRLGIGLDEVLHHGMPEDRRAAQAFFRYLAGTGTLEDVGKTWDWVTVRSFADDRLAGEYVEVLLKHRQYESAARAWASHWGERGGDYLRPNGLFNADFEAEPSGMILDWRIQRSPGVEATRDNAVAYSGKSSLRIRFDGTQNVAYSGVSQAAYVRSGPYRFQAQVRSEGISTDQGIEFRIFDLEAPARLDVRTESVVGTTGWRKIETAVHVPGQTKMVQIQIVRQPSLKFDSKIKGVAWVDALKLEAAR